MCRCIPLWSLLKHVAQKSRDISYYYGHSPDVQCDWSHCSCGQYCSTCMYTTVEFSMARELTAKQDKYTFESLEDVCEFMLHLCNNKSIHEETPLMMAASSGTRVDRESFWG